MDPRLQIRVQRYGWDAAVSHYQDGWQASLLPAQRTLLEMADLAPGLKIIETACGTGLVTRMMSEAVGPGGRILATDLSQKMVDAVKAAGGNVKFTIYPDAGHSYMSRHPRWLTAIAPFTPLRAGYDEEAAEDSWQRMLDFFREHMHERQHA